MKRGVATIYLKDAVGTISEQAPKHMRSVQVGKRKRTPGDQAETKSSWPFALVFGLKLKAKVKTKGQIMAPSLTMGNNKRAITNLALSSNRETMYPDC